MSDPEDGARNSWSYAADAERRKEHHRASRNGGGSRIEAFRLLRHLQAVGVSSDTALVDDVGTNDGTVRQVREELPFFTPDETTEAVRIRRREMLEEVVRKTRQRERRRLAPER